MVTKEVLGLVMMEVVEFGIKIPATLIFTIVDKLLMGEIDKGFRPETLPPIIQVVLVYFWFSMFMVMRELHICLRPSTFLPITTVDYTFPTQCSLKMILLGVF